MNARVAVLAAIVALGLLVPIAVAISGGLVDENNTYSNVGCLVALSPDGSPPFVANSGILIHPRVLLTAGHSADFLVQNPWAIPLSRVSFGTNAFDPSTWHEIVAAITHPDYTPNPQGMGNSPQSNDVGVIILKEPITDLPLAKLPYAGFLDDLKAAHLLREPGEGGTPITVVGYGTDRDWGTPADGWRRSAQIDYLALTQAWLFTQMNPVTGNGGIRNGDSGGPNFWRNPDDGSLVLVAVTSRAPSAVTPSVAWRVDIPETLDFINQVISGL
jgi:hypothetical protein